MRCTALRELSPPPPGKVGWPWTEESPQLPDTMPDGRPWPLISIVTPSYNQGQFIEGTIRSVLLQGYPNLEYIIIDGGSNDGSVEVIRKYEKWLAYWVSESDKGQAHAINKGFQHVTGEILAWLNSDDEYCTRTLYLVARHFQEQPEIELLYGDCRMIDARGYFINYIKGQQSELAQLLGGNFIPQPSTFFRRLAWEAVGGLDVKLHFALDYDLWIRMMLKGMKSQYVPLPLSQFRWHNVSKSRNYLAQFGIEYLGILERVFQEQQDERFKGVKLYAYYQGFRIIAAGYQQGIEEYKNHQGKILQILALWARHLERHQKDYIQNPHLWAESLYRIGHNYCFHGHMRKGRRFLSMALQVNKKAYKAFLGWGMACLGVKTYKWCTWSWQALLRLLLRFNKQFLPKYYERYTEEK